MPRNHNKKTNQIASIQALRAFAVAWVVIDHAFPHLLPGGFVGVDVFFVISGFLISVHLYDQLRAGKFSFGRFYLRRARRLLPAALTVLVATSVASMLLLPPAWLYETLMSLGAAAVYVVNWWLAASAVDYFADSGVVSPANHYWSLSVEEQFYIIWPALLALAWWLAKVASGRGREIKFGLAAAGMIALVMLTSLLLAEWAVQRNATTAYFFTYTRAWEFAAGGLTGIFVCLNLIPMWKPLRPVLFLLAWATLISSGWLVGPTSGVPGIITVPIVFATAVLLFLGDDHGLWVAHKLIASRAIQWMGDTSYSLYLWHWPLLILAPFAVNAEKLSILQTMIVLFVSLAVAGLTKVYIEDTFRTRDFGVFFFGKKDMVWPQLALFLVFSTLVGAGAWGAARQTETRSVEIAQELFDQSIRPGECFGARAREDGADCPDSHKLADEFYALQNWKTQVSPLPNRVGFECQAKMGEAEPKVCSFGAAPELAKKNIALIGDSHAGMWMAALAMFAEAEGLRITTFLASSCPATDSTESFAHYLPADKREGCHAWRAAASGEILSNSEFDIVITSASAYNHRTWTPAGWADDDGSGFAALWQRFLDAGKRVIVIDDVPLLRTKLPECLALPHPEMDPCARPASEVPTETAFSRAVETISSERFTFLPMREVFCDADRCHAIVGGIPAYMDRDHISAPFVRSFAEQVRSLVVSSE